MAKNVEGLENLDLEKDETPYVLELTDLIEVGPGYEVPKEEKTLEFEREGDTKPTDIEKLEEELSLEQEELKVFEVSEEKKSPEQQGPEEEIVIPVATIEVPKEVTEPFVKEELKEDVLRTSATSEISTGVQAPLDMERLESLISEVVNRAVEKATKEAMLEIAERLIGEAIERLKESMLKHT